MFYEDLNKIENKYQSLFRLNVIHDIKKEKVDLSVSRALINDDFVIIKLRNKDDEYCPVDIYLGINKSFNRYGLYLNEKAIVYNYEKFEDYKAFENELYYFLSSPIQAEIVTDKNGNKIYSDYNVPAKNGKGPLSFREYHNKIWTNFFGLKKTTKKTKNYSAWL